MCVCVRVYVQKGVMSENTNRITWRKLWIFCKEKEISICIIWYVYKW